MDWKDSYGDPENSDDEDPFPKMLESDVDSILGPYVATELDTVQKVNAPTKEFPKGCRRSNGCAYRRLIR